MEKITTTLRKYFNNNDIREPERPIENVIFVGNTNDPFNPFGIGFTLFDRYFRNCEFQLCSVHDYCINFVDCIFENCVFYEGSICADFTGCVFLNNTFPDGFRCTFHPATKFHFCKYDDSFLESLSKEMVCPVSGEFVGWKKAYLCKRFKDSIGFNVYPVIVKLLIPSESKRSSAFSNKCRCEKAMVLEVQTEDGCKIDIPEDYFVASMYEFESKSRYSNLSHVVSMDRIQTRYIPGKMVYPDKFNPDPLVECGGGIHFFMTREEALDYSF